MKLKHLAFLPLSALFLLSPMQSNEAHQRISETKAVQIRYAANDSIDIDECFSSHNLPSEFGSKKGGYFNYDGKYYQNYDAGYLELTVNSATSYLIKNYAGRNIGSDGAKTKVELSYLLKGVADDFCTTGSDDYSAPLSSPSNVKPIIEAKMKALYQELYEKDVVLGTRNSYVKCWDGYIVQDFAFGDSSFSFGGDRYGMSFIFYNYRLNSDEAKGECFALSGIEANYWDSNKNQLGYPTTNLLTENVALPGSSEKSDVTFQAFEGGFLYRDSITGALVYKNGFKYDASTKSFIAEATPYVDSRYGAYLTEYSNEDRTKIVKVHKKGSVICELVNGEYVYTYRPARIYKSLTEFDYYDVNDLLSDVGNSFEGDYTNQDVISRKLKQKYKELYKAGYFVGFKESTFHGNWNGVDAQQFILGDSTANPWEGTRTNVAALVYRSDTNKVVLLADNPLYLWNKGGNYNTYGAPIDDAFTVGEDVFQNFEGGLLVVLRNNVDTSFLYKGTYDEYVAGKANYQKPTFGKEITTTSSSSMKPMAYVLAIGVPLLVVLAGIGVVLLLERKKKKKANNESAD